MHFKKITSLILIFAIVLFSTSFFLFNPKTARAGSLTALSDTMSNQTASAYSTHLIKFKTPTAIHTNGNTIVITFPTDFDFTSIVIGEITMKDGPTTGLENTETLAASATTTAWGAVFSGTVSRILTLTAPTDGIGAYDIAANTVITIAYAATHSKNATTAGSKSITIVTPTDSGTLAIPIITNGQVSIDATVAPVITFSNDATALHFGTLSSGAATFANTSSGSASYVTGNTFTISTNGTSGYTLTYAPGATLTSGSNTISAVTVAGAPSGTAGTPQFGMTATYTNSSGGGTLTTAYSRASNNWKFTAAGDTLVSTTGPVSGDTVAMGYLANISNVTPAGVYTQTNTWIATGNF